MTHVLTNMQTYDEMLKSAMAKMPKREGTGERFEMPVIETNIQGGVTIMRNFYAVAAKLRREPRQILKFLTKELAAPGNLEGDRASIQAKFAQRVIQGKLESYVKEFVFCKICTRPDTKLVKESGVIIMRCEACGARGSVREL